MKHKLKNFARYELCLVSTGEKWHIRQGNQTYCGLYDQLTYIGRGILEVREDYERICKRCLTRYRKYNNPRREKD